MGGLTALALLAVIVLSPSRATYAAGWGLIVLLLLAYADWHALGVAESALGIEADHGPVGAEHGHDGDGRGHGHEESDHGHSHGDDEEHDHGDAGHDHDGSTVSVLADRLRNDAYVLVSKAAEAIAVVVLAVLALGER